jgi:hypothetical protein
MLLRQTLIRFTQLGVKIFDLLAQPGKSFLGYVGHLRIRGDALQERIHLLNALRGALSRYLKSGAASSESGATVTPRRRPHATPAWPML